MGKITKRVIVELSFDSETEEQPYIKDWWLRDRIEQPIRDSLKHINSLISDIHVELESVTNLPEEVTISTLDILK